MHGSAAFLVVLAISRYGTRRNRIKAGSTEKELYRFHYYVPLIISTTAISSTDSKARGVYV